MRFLLESSFRSSYNAAIELRCLASTLLTSLLILQSRGKFIDYLSRRGSDWPINFYGRLLLPELRQEVPSA